MDRPTADGIWHLFRQADIALVGQGKGENVRKILFCRLLLAGVAASALTMPAQAQTTTDATGEQAAAEETIVVTGSRIARPDLEANTPIAIVGETQIAQEGAANIQDVLQELPQVGIGLTRATTNFLTAGNGVATVNLRNLGNQRTLVLVNNRRFVAGLAGTSTVDINNIPTDFIERVEVVTGGASAIYGSEAIAGVVNFILRDDFDGIQARAQYGITERGDNPRYLVSLTGGTTWGADDRGSIILNFSHDRDEGLRSRDRRRSSQDCLFLTCGPAAYSSFAPQGRFQLRDANDAPVNAIPTATGGRTSLFTFDRTNNNAFTVGFPTGFGFNRNAERRISTPVERYLVAGIAKYDITDSAEAFLEVTYGKTKSSSSLEPFAGEDADFFPNGGGIPITNPYIPGNIQAIIAANNSDADPTNDIANLGFRRRFNEVFDRSNVNNRDTWRVAAGIRGDLGSNWNYDVSYVFGRLEDLTTSQDIDTSRFRQAVDAIRLPSGEIVCRSEEARANGCVPINIFGAGAASREASAYVTTNAERFNRVINTQNVVNANLSGSLFELPAGPLGVAVGAEYREEKSSDQYDPLTNTGGNTGNQIPNTKGRFDVTEVYGEVRVPILADRPFFQELSVNGAARYSDYSTVGGVFSWNAGAEWSPFDGLRFRGAYAEANRAPNIGELFSAASETFPAVNDPCNLATATSNRPLDVACRAIPGIAANIAQNGIFEYTNADLQGINGFDSGNPNLEEETAKTLTLGVVVAPRAVPGFSFSADYFDIKVDNAINAVPRDTSIEQCLATGLEVFCNSVIRDPNTGFILTVNAAQQNIASIETSGVDFVLRYGRDLGFAGDDRLDLNLAYTYLIKLNQTPIIGADEIKERGQLADGPDGTRLGAGFKHKATARATYTIGGFTGSWQVNYFGKIKADKDFDPSTISDDPVEQEQLVDINEVGDAFYHDIQLRYAVGEEERFQFYVGVDNLFDRDPPNIPTGFVSSITGTETAADVYDVYGRRFYAGVQVRF